MEVSVVSLGCMGFPHAYGPGMDEKEAAKVIEKAVDMGYLYFDTAEYYTGNREDGSIAYNEDLVLEELQVGYVAFSPLANGILSDAFGKGSKFAEGDYRNFMPQYKNEAIDANQALME